MTSLTKYDTMLLGCSHFSGRNGKAFENKMSKEKQIAFIERLVQCDHSFMKPEFVKEANDVFGSHIGTYLAKANPKDFKGLTLNDGATEAEGQDAHKIAEQLAEHLGLEWQEMFGIGSELRECCRVILEHLRK